MAEGGTRGNVDRALVYIFSRHNRTENFGILNKIKALRRYHKKYIFQAADISAVKPSRASSSPWPSGTSQQLGVRGGLVFERLGCHAFVLNLVWRYKNVEGDSDKRKDRAAGADGETVQDHCQLRD